MYICNMENKAGERYLTNEGYWITIITHRKYTDCDIQFDNGLILKNKTYQNIKNGEIKNPYHPSKYGIGYIGIGKYRARINNIKTEVYKNWTGLLERCYSKSFQIKHPTYNECTVDKRWHNFQVFAEWYENNYQEGFELDKDILVRGNKIYSPETCCFVPREINIQFTNRRKTKHSLPLGVVKSGLKFVSHFFKNLQNIYLGTFNTSEEAFQAYKIAKESYIKELANKYKKQITKQVYQELINYKIIDNFEGNSNK